MSTLVVITAFYAKRSRALIIAVCRFPCRSREMISRVADQAATFSLAPQLCALARRCACGRISVQLAEIGCMDSDFRAIAVVALLSRYIALLRHHYFLGHLLERSCIPSTVTLPMGNPCTWLRVLKRGALYVDQVQVPASACSFGGFVLDDVLMRTSS